MTAAYLKEGCRLSVAYIGGQSYGVLAVGTRSYEMIGKGGLMSLVITNMHQAAGPMILALYMLYPTSGKQTRILSFQPVLREVQGC